MEEEIQNLLQKGAVVMASPCQDQFISRLFQERRVIQTCSELEASELFQLEVSFQDGWVRDDQRSIEERRLDVYLGPERRIPVSSNCPGTPEVSEVYMEREDLRVHMSSIWTLQCSSHIHETPPPSHGSSAEAGTLQ